MSVLNDGDAGVCEYCGSFVIRKRAIDGGRYSIPINDESIMEFVRKRPDIEFAVHDRLRRAERIIEDLRAQLRQREERSQP